MTPLKSTHTQKCSFEDNETNNNPIWHNLFNGNLIYIIMNYDDKH